MLRHALPLAALLFASLPSYADPLEDALTHLITKARAGSSASAVVLLASDSGERIVVIDGDATPQTRFYLASVGKTLVAAAVLNAVERGATGRAGRRLANGGFGRDPDFA
jgi:CubicO group peptidase (beta-lactamase class C family)